MSDLVGNPEDRFSRVAAQINYANCSISGDPKQKPEKQRELTIQLCRVKKLQVNLIITLSLGSMETDRVISEPCYNEVIYNRHIAK